MRRWCGRTTTLADLHTLGPAHRLAGKGGANGTPMVAIDAVTRGDPQLASASEPGLEHAAVYLERCR